MNKVLTNWQWHFEKLPFIWRTQSSIKDTMGIPETLAFTLSLVPKSGLLVQKSTPYLEETVQKAYSLGTIATGLMEHDGIGRSYAEDFLSYIQSLEIRPNYQGLKVLEIGCGTGYLLHRLAQMGARVTGIDPGKHAKLGAERYGLEIINGFFPSKQLTGVYDLLILYCLLEHMKEPRRFLSSLKPYLAVNGAVLIAVPDCAEYIANGDLSPLVHIHYSYFTRKSLLQTLRLAGFSGQAQPAGFGGIIYCLARQGASRPSPVGQDVMQKNLAQSVSFQKKAIILLKSLNEYFLDAANSGQRVGIFVPGRALNALSLVEADIDACRFFDDNEMLHNRHYPGFAQKSNPEKTY
jgi:2-polyprenyl-3-methyl-5-hydroxy-6-metoxy-1,4-benzoquinol methylase